MKGPFFVKNEEGKFELADFCKECAFCDDEEGACVMLKCLVVPDYSEESEDT